MAPEINPFNELLVANGAGKVHGGVSGFRQNQLIEGNQYSSRRSPCGFGRWRMGGGALRMGALNKGLNTRVSARRRVGTNGLWSGGVSLPNRCDTRIRHSKV